MDTITATPGGHEVLAYGAYQKDRREGGGDMTYGDGSPVEYVEIRDEETSHEGGARRFTLDRSINGSRPEVGAKVQLELRDWVQPDAKVAASGRPYIAGRRRNVVSAFVKV